MSRPTPHAPRPPAKFLRAAVACFGFALAFGCGFVSHGLQVFRRGQRNAGPLGQWQGARPVVGASAGFLCVRNHSFLPKLLVDMPSAPVRINRQRDYSSLSLPFVIAGSL